MAYIKDTKEVELEELELMPRFVIKSKIFTPYKIYPSQTKIFINVCSHKKIPTRDLVDKETNKIIEEFEPELIFLAISNNEWEIPILNSFELRECFDKKGVTSLLIDCVINEKYMNWCMINLDLRDILIQWCFDSIEFQIGDGFIIDRDNYAIPKRLFMGDHIPSISVDLKYLSNVSKELEELNNDMNEPLNIIRDSNDMEEEELRVLIPEVKKPGIIVEVEEEKEDDGGEKIVKCAERKKEKNGKITFKLEFEKLEKPTKLNQMYQIQISSNLEKIANVKLNIDVERKELFLLNSENEDEVIYHSLLPLVIKCEKITSFYVLKEKKFYIFMD